MRGRLSLKHIAARAIETPTAKHVYALSSGQRPSHRPAWRAQPNCSAKLLSVRVFVESHQHGLADLDRRRPQIAGWAEHQSRQRFVVRAILLEVDFGRFLSFGDHQLVHPLQQLNRLFLAIPLFAGINLFVRFNFFGGKKLLRVFAGRSSLTVVAPVDLLAHDICSVKEECRSAGEVETLAVRPRRDDFESDKLQFYVV